MASSKKHIRLDKLASKGVSALHIQLLRKFLVMQGEIIEDSSKLRGVKGKSKIPPDHIVSEPHYLHNLVRGVYKSDGDIFALSIQMNPKSKWGTEIDFETGKWKIDYDFGNPKKYASDIASLKRCYENNVPIGVIYKQRKGVNQILGLGAITKFEGTKFQIVPYEMEQEYGEITKLAYDYVKDQSERNDYSSCGGERTILTRVKTKFFREQLLVEYSRKCAFCEFGIESYLVGSHIVPFNVMQKEDGINAMNPNDGLLLCKLCDKSFEDGHIVVNKNYEIVISGILIKQAKTDSAVRSWISNIKNTIPIRNDSRYTPNKKYLERKIELITTEKS